MNWTTASMDLEDDQAKTRSTNLNEFTVRGGKSPYKSIKPITSIILMATLFCFSFSDPLLMEGLLHYKAPFESSLSYICWPFEPLLEYLSHQTPSLTFYELW